MQFTDNCGLSVLSNALYKLELSGQNWGGLKEWQCVNLPLQSVWSSNSGISDLGSADNTEAFEESRASKKKKKRMQKVDASFLGFTVHGAPDRYNAGGIDTGTPNS